MALNGLTVLCGYAGSSTSRDKSQSIIGKVVWSEEPASGVATTNVAADVTDAAGQAIFRVRATADSWISVGKTPNATVSPRIFVAANNDYDIFVEGGHKLVWIAA